MARQVLEQARALTVLVRRRFLEDASTDVARTRECRIDVRDAYLDEVRNDAIGGCHLVGRDVADDDRAVGPGTQLSPVRLADANAFLEAVRRFQSFHRRSYIRIDQNRSHGDRRGGPVRQHERGI